MYDLKLEMFQKIYVVFGDPKNQCILSAQVRGIVINADIKSEKKYTVYFTYNRIKFIRSKNKVPKNFGDKLLECGSVYNNLVDLKEPIAINSYGMHNWPVFTSKEKCIEFLRRCK